MVRRDFEASGRRRKSRDALTSRPEVERLLDAASAPASPRELAGERAAVDLFARARLVSSVTVTATPKRSSRVGFKAAAASAAAVVAMSSGVSFAATGHVPFSDTLKQVTRAVTGHTADDQTSGVHHVRNGGPTSPNGPKAAALQGLCQAFQHGQKTTHGHALEARPFRALVAAAGGQDQVASFCAALPPRGHTDASHPSHPAHPTTGPSGNPSEPGHTNGTHPTHPSHPTQPTHPTHPTHPTQPTHPTHTSRPTQTSKPHPTH